MVTAPKITLFEVEDLPSIFVGLITCHPLPWQFDYKGQMEWPSNDIFLKNKIK